MIGFPFDSRVTYDSSGTPSYDRAITSEPYRKLLKELFKTGIMPTDSTNMQVTAGTALNVIVLQGFAMVEGCMKLETEDVTLQLETADTTYSRIDTIALRLDDSEDVRACEYTVITGTPASTPVAPDLQRTASIYDIGLANVLVPANATTILASNITDTRYDTTRCGVISSISEFDTTAIYTQVQADLKAFKNNEEAYFTTWSTAEKADFEAWAQTQKTDFEAWEDTEKTAFDAWFSNLKNELDSNQASHLQNEIDNLQSELDNIKLVHLVITYDSSLAGATITATNGTETHTATATSTGETTIDGMALGTWTISESTYGTTATVDTVYYGNYSLAIGGDIFITVTHSTEFAGDTITLTNGTKTYTRTATASGSALFVVADTGTWTVKITHDSTDYTKSITVTQAGTYTVDIQLSTWNYQAWLDSASITKSFNSLEEVLADEETLRELFTKHDSVDFLANNVTEADATTIFATDLCAKWINLRDYALDTLYASAVCKSAMDTADKYFYGEWALIDSTWQPKGNVPVMTGTSAPYGTVGWSSYWSDSYPAYKAFHYSPLDDVSTDDGGWLGARDASDAYVQYMFTNPTCVKKIALWSNYGVTGTTYTAKLSASNDGSTWTTIDDTLTLIGVNHNIVYSSINNEAYYLYYRYQIDGSVLGTTGGIRLQFYGRTLSVSVPTMTSNDEPWGEAIANTEYTGYEKYHAFDGSTSTAWSPNPMSQTSGDWNGFDFKKVVCVKAIALNEYRSSALPCNLTLQGSNDGFVSDIHDIKTGITVTTSGTTFVFPITNTMAYRYYRVYQTSVSESAQFSVTQFYGLDYSEREFATGSTMKYIYDHGLELEELSSYVYGDSIVTKESGRLYMTRPTASSASQVYTSKSIDLTDYSLERIIYDNDLYMSSNATYCCLSINTDIPLSLHGKPSAYSSTTTSELPYNQGLNVSSFSGNYYPMLLNDVGSTTDDIITVNEWWLE